MTLLCVKIARKKKKKKKNIYKWAVKPILTGVEFLWLALSAPVRQIQKILVSLRHLTNISKNILFIFLYWSWIYPLSSLDTFGWIFRSF